MISLCLWSVTQTLCSLEWNKLSPASKLLPIQCPLSIISYLSHTSMAWLIWGFLQLSDLSFLTTPPLPSISAPITIITPLYSFIALRVFLITYCLSFRSSDCYSGLRALCLQSIFFEKNTSSILSEYLYTYLFMCIYVCCIHTHYCTFLNCVKLKKPKYCSSPVLIIMLFHFPNFEFSKYLQKLLLVLVKTKRPWVDLKFIRKILYR